MKMKKAKILIFDMDGVILNSEPLHEKARQIMFQEEGIVLDDSFPDPVGKSTDDFWNLIFEKLGIEGDGKAKGIQHYRLVAELVEKEHVGLNDGLLKVFDWAKNQGMKVAIASSSPRFLVDEVLRILGIGQYFDCTISGDEVLYKKPAPDIYRKVLEKMGISADDAIAVEDSGTGVEAAKAAGCYCFGYINPTSGEQDIRKADCAITHFEQIIEKYIEK